MPAPTAQHRLLIVAPRSCVPSHSRIKLIFLARFCRVLSSARIFYYSNFPPTISRTTDKFKQFSRYLFSVIVLPRFFVLMVRASHVYSQNCCFSMTRLAVARILFGPPSILCFFLPDTRSRASFIAVSRLFLFFFQLENTKNRATGKRAASGSKQIRF